ncbi:hypothetical protein Lokhon_02101 [Limimaricola hongkongensis DSM 17492]|uniref:Uncharacterized protein n=1 Tax=Limimaricola hongkongensis DSM 17492 TaxID=1122180 RepID=A0A017HE35_9RHOB|nr:hypothetical protein Lokhon_02101 [Limimaricola hongkongensis DSM 17492]
MRPAIRAGQSHPSHPLAPGQGHCRASLAVPRRRAKNGHHTRTRLMQRCNCNHGPGRAEEGNDQHSG